MYIIPYNLHDMHINQKRPSACDTAYKVKVGREPTQDFTHLQLQKINIAIVNRKNPTSKMPTGRILPFLEPYKIVPTLDALRPQPT